MSTWRSTRDSRRSGSDGNERKRPRVGVARASASVVVLFVSASVCAVGVAATHGAAHRAAARCMSQRLVVWLAPNDGGAAAGSVFYSLNFTNLSGHACVLAGYPGVSAVDLGGRQLGSAASRSPHEPYRAVRLRAGDTASAQLQISQAANFPIGDCHRVNAAGLRVYPPNALRSKVVPIPFNACSHTGPVYLHVERVR
jgi:hypothetical protein